MCAITWRATVIALVVASQMMLGPLTSTGIVTARSLEDDEIEKHLNRLNKPAVKSLKLENGDTVDCVDIYKQPAFDHPRLKDHKIQMWPSFLPKTEKSADASDPHPLLPTLWQKSEGCPDGTIPIRRVQKDDLIRATSVESFGRRRLAGNAGKIESAVVVLDSGGPYAGSDARINVWGIPVEQNEWSTAHLEMSDGGMNYVQSGWMVNPLLHGDGTTRLYAYWTADGGQSTGCFNQLCPGFVHVGQDYFLGAPLANLSVYEGTQYELRVNILLDTANDQWWLLIENRPVGYWPVSLFGGDSSFAAAPTIKWGGSVLNMNNGGHHSTSKMGSGHPARVRWTRAAYVEGVTIRYNSSVKTPNLPPNHDLLKDFTDNGRCYSVLINVDPGDDNFMYFGGPGGDCDSDTP